MEAPENTSHRRATAYRCSASAVGEQSLPSTADASRRQIGGVQSAQKCAAQSVQVCGFDEAVLRDRDVSLPQDPLDCLVGYAWPVEVRRKPSTKGMPPPARLGNVDLSPVVILPEKTVHLTLPCTSECGRSHSYRVSICASLLMQKLNGSLQQFIAPLAHPLDGLAGFNVGLNPRPLQLPTIPMTNFHARETDYDSAG